MLLGDGSKIQFLQKKDFQTTSTIHLLVASGQNLSISVDFFMGLVYLAGRAKTIDINLLAIIFYSLLTGLGVPILRSAVMSSTILFGQLLGKNTTS